MARIKSIVFTVTNDLSYDQRMKRICTVLANAGYSVTLIGFKKIASIPLGKSDYHEKRLNLIFKKGKLFYVEFNIRLFLLLLIGKRYHIYGAVDLDTILHAAGNEKIAGIAAAHFDHIGLGSEAWNVGGQDDFGLGHRTI